MKRAQFVVLMLFVAAGAGAADDPKAVVGEWATKDSVIEVSETNGALHATIIAILNPVYKEGEDGPVGATRVDLKNPDEGLRARPIVGLDLLEDYAFKDGKWQGSIYDPGSGKVYKSQITVSSDGKLLMRGYIGAPMFGRTQEWIRASTCLGDIPKMLASVNLNSCE
jgi:uncharacterized protein (DUF2147 family)